MKRAAPALDDKGKKAKRNLAFLGTCVSTARLLSDGAAWKAAKAAAASGHVDVTCIREDSSTSTLCIQGSVTAPTTSSKVAAAAHTHPFPGHAQVQLLVDTRSGELLDADTSCCPGGYHAARGSFCPCVGAVLLAAAQLQSLEHGEHQDLAMTRWSGTDALQTRDHAARLASSLQQVVQPGVLLQAPSQVLQELGEVEVAASRSRMLPKLMTCPYQNQSNQPKVVLDAIETMNPPLNPQYIQPPLLSNVPCDLPGCTAGGTKGTLDGVSPTAQSAAGTPATAPGAAAGDAQTQDLSRQAQLLAALGGAHLTTYMGKMVQGWEQRPKVVNLAFALLLTSIAGSQNYSGPAASSSSAAASGSTSIADAKPLVALTGLVRVLWHTIYVEGLPVELRGVLLVAMALRNLLLVVALPLWARKAVAAQLRDWQEGISEVHACYSVQHAENIKLVHLLRVLKEAEQLCKHGWDHPFLTAALQSLGNNSIGAPTAGQAPQQLASSGYHTLAEEAGLVLLRLSYLELLGERAAYLDLAMAGNQWTLAIDTLLRSGDRYQLRLAAELLPRHITSLPQRLDYMQQLLGLEELPVVERCELAARLLLSLRGDLVPGTQHPELRASKQAWWQVQVWAVPGTKEAAKEQAPLQAPLQAFLKQFFRLAGQAQFSLARVAVASQGNSVGTQEATQAAGASSGPAEPAVPVPSGATLPSSTTVSRTEALAELDCLPVQPYRVVTSFLNAGRTDIEGLGTEIHLMLQQGWGARLHPIWQQLVAVAGSKQLGGAPTDVSGARKAAPVSPTSPLEMDEELLRRGEPAPRSVTKTPSWIKLDDMGFVQKTVGHPDTSTVEPFPLPNLLPLCGLAPAALHAVVEGAVAPLFEAAFCPTSSSSTGGAAKLSSSRPGDLGSTLLQVAGHPCVEHGGAAVQLQMAVDMVAYAAALTPLAGLQGKPLSKDVYQHLLYGLLAMGQQDLAWTVAQAAYRVCPGRFTATYLLLLGIQRGPEAQAAAVDWILARDWPQEVHPKDPTGGSQCVSATAFSAGDSSSLDTQQLLGGGAAAAIHLADTASSRGVQKQQHKAQQAGSQPQAAAAPEDTPGTTSAWFAGNVRCILNTFVDTSQMAGRAMDAADAIESLAGVTGLPFDTLQDELTSLVIDLDKDSSSDDSDSDAEDRGYLSKRIEFDRRIEVVVAAISQLAQTQAAGQTSPGEMDMGPLAESGLARPPTAATAMLEEELLGVTGKAWRKRANLLQLLELQPVIQYTAACGLHPDLVTRLALVELGAEPQQASTAPITWEGWVTNSHSIYGKEYHYTVGLPTPPQGETMPTAQVAAEPGASIQAVFGAPLASKGQVPTSFAAWVTYWLEAGPSDVPGGTGRATTTGTSQVAALLRQLWLLLQGRCYTPWMLWFAAALDRAGEQQLVCEAAAQGMLPSSCHFWDIIAVKRVYATCFQTLLPMLARSSDPAILQLAAITQLFMAQAPVPVEILLGEGVLERLLPVSTQLGTIKKLYGRVGVLHAPASCINPVTGKMSFEGSPIMKLLERCVFSPLAAHASSEVPGGVGMHQALHSEVSPPEAAVSIALEQGLTKLHWSMGLYMARMARDTGAVRSWPGLVQVLRTPLAAAVNMFNSAARGLPSCATLEAWASQHGLHSPVSMQNMQEASGWINGVLAWVAAELYAHTSAPAGTAARPSPWCVEELSACLLDFRSPHVLLYAAAAMQALQGRSTADITASLIPNGVLPLVGRPEYLQACDAMGTLSHYWAWGQTCYTQGLQRLLQHRQLLASLPPATIKNMALTYWVKCGTLEAMAWVGQLRDWAQQRAAGSGSVREGTSEGLEEGIAQQVLPPPQQPRPVVSPEDVLSIQVHPELAPFLDLAPAPATASRRTLLRFVRMHTAASRQDVLGALEVLFQESPEALAPGAHPRVPQSNVQLKQQVLELDSMFAILGQQPYAGSPAMRWLSQQPQYHNLMQLLQGVPAPSVLDTNLAALNSPQLQLRALQYQLWKLSQAIYCGPPSANERMSRGPVKPWQQQLTELQPASAMPSYMSCLANWARLPEAGVQAAFMAARAATPGAAPLPRPKMLSTVLGWMEAQEVALAWAVVQYAELPGVGQRLHRELRALMDDPAQLGQLPVFMAHLGAAVKQEWARYPLYALFRPVRLPQSVYEHVRRASRVGSVNQLHEYLYTFNRLALQRLMVQAMPWLDWQQASKDAEARTLAEWLWWLLVDTRQQRLAGADVKIGK